MSSEELQSSKRMLLNISTYSFLTFVSLVFHYVHGAYFRRSNSSGGLFYAVDDLPASITGSRPNSVLGEHWFGDLLDNHFSVSQSGEGGYFGASYFFFTVSKNLAYDHVFYLYLGLSATLLILSVVLWAQTLTSEQRPLAVALHFSYPFLFALDRGQVSLLYGYLLSIGLALTVRQRADSAKDLKGPAVLGAAFSMKIHPILIGLGLIRSWSRRQFLLAGGVFLGIIGAASMISPRGALHLFYQQNPDGTYRDPGYFFATLSFNTSFRSLLAFLSAGSSGLIHVAADFFYTKYMYSVGLLLVLLISSLMRNDLAVRERLFLSAIVSVSVAPIAPVYAQVAIAAVAIAGFADQVEIPRYRQCFYEIGLLVALVPHNLPMDFGIHNRDTFTSQSTMTPLIQISFLAYIGIGGLSQIVSTSRRFKRKAEVQRSEN